MDANGWRILGGGPPQPQRHRSADQRGLGLAFPELEERDVPKVEQLLELLWRDGVEAIAPTLVTCAVEPLRRALRVLRQVRDRHQPGRCRLLGAHLEGPFLAEARRGAHPAEDIAAPSLQALEQRIGGFEADIALITLAPEQAGGEQLVQRLGALGITTALGHSTADADQAAQAFDQGVRMLTHSLQCHAGAAPPRPRARGRSLQARQCCPGPDR